MNKKKLALKIGILASVAITAGGIAYAMFTDSAKVTGNSFTAGNADLQIKLPDTGCNAWAENCQGIAWPNLYPQWHNTYQVFLKNNSQSDIPMKVVPNLEETGSDQGLLDNTYMEITSQDGVFSTGRFNLTAWKNNTELELLPRMNQGEESGPWLVKFDIPEILGNEIANQNILFDLVFGATQTKNFTLTVKADKASGGTVTGSGTYGSGLSVNITATPTNSDWIFDGWSGSGIADPSALSTTVLMDGSKTVTANFYYNASWYLPTSFSDPGNLWDFEENLYDDNLGTYAQTLASGWQPNFVYLGFNSPINANKLRYWLPSCAGGCATVNQIDVDIDRGGWWEDVYEGVFNTGGWDERSFGQGTVAGIRFRLGGGNSWRYVHEMQAWRVE